MNYTFNKARTFIYRNARPLDLARWQYHFENDSKVAVLTALAVYQNEDGGFGHALEPDAWNPNSAPIQTWTATEILREIDFTDNNHSIIQGILRYLASGKDFEGKFWYNTVQSNNDYPHAPWWHTESDSSCHNDYNPTACLAGFIIRFADKNSELYTIGCRIAKEAYDAYFGQDLIGDMHTAGCYIRLWQYCEEAGAVEVIDLSALKEKLLLQVKSSITKDTAEWETSYICRPSQFFNSQDSVFYAENKEIAEYECEHIVKTQLEDGSWNIPWGWNGYPEEWVVSKIWWKSNGAILNMRYLKGMGKLEVQFYSRKLEGLNQLIFHDGNVSKLNPDNPSDYKMLQVFYLPFWPDMQRKDLDWDYFAVIENDEIFSLAGAMHMTEYNWEIAGVYTLPKHRGKGLAKAVCSFTAKYILEHGKQATCNTEIDNISMSKVMDSIGMVAQ